MTTTTQTFPIHGVDDAPEGSQAILSGIQKSLGGIPNLFGLFSASPAVLKGYTTLSELLDKDTAFDETERQVLFLSVSAENGCTYCVAAHSTISGMKKVPADVVQALRDGTPLSDPKLEALRQFGLAVVRERGWVQEADVAAFLAAGYTRRHVLEVVLAISLKTISNYVNHMADTPLDDMFAPQAWSSQGA